MPIDYERKFIFIHIPKTAGTSILYNLFNIPLTKDEIHDTKSMSLEYQRRHFIGDDSENGFIRLNHCTLYKIAKHKDNINIKSFFIFSFVSNPFDIIVS